VSPNESTLAIETLAHPDGRVRILTVGTDGTGLAERYSFQMVTGFRDRITWTPDGENILFGAANDRGVWRVLRIAASGGIPVMDGVDLSNLPRVKPAVGGFDGISADGSRIAFHAATVQTVEVWALENVMTLLSGRRQQGWTFQLNTRREGLKVLKSEDP
jgi:hypothetical protein